MLMVTTLQTSNSSGVLFFPEPSSSSTSPLCQGCAETVRAVRGTSNMSCAMPSVLGFEVYSGLHAMLAKVSEVCNGDGDFLLLPDPWAGEGRWRCRQSVTCIHIVHAR